MSSWSNLKRFWNWNSVNAVSWLKIECRCFADNLQHTMSSIIWQRSLMNLKDAQSIKLTSCINMMTFWIIWINSVLLSHEIKTLSANSNITHITHADHVITLCSEQQFLLHLKQETFFSTFFFNAISFTWFFFCIKSISLLSNIHHD